MSSTPRTDEQINGKPCTKFQILAGDCLRNAAVPSEFARQLERELNAANAIIRQQQLLDEGNLRLQDRIQRLEEAFEASEELIKTFSCGCPYGDEVYRCSRCVAAMNKYDAAKKAKEANP
jgi:hypothetical protein